MTSVWPQFLFADLYNQNLMLQSSGCAISLLSQKTDNLQLDDLSRHKKYSRVETTLNTKVDMGYEDLSDQKIFIRWVKNVM